MINLQRGSIHDKKVYRMRRTAGIMIILKGKRQKEISVILLKTYINSIKENINLILHCNILKYLY